MNGKKKEKINSAKEDNSNSDNYAWKGVGTVAIGYLLYQVIKGLIALGAAAPTGGMSLGFLAAP